MNSSVEEIIRSLLKERGYSLTSVRKAVCGVMWGQEPLAMRELIEKLAGSVDRASVYRTVQLFEQLGLIERIYIGWKYKIELSDLLVHHHHHISCLGCKKVVAITEATELEQLIERLAAAHAFSAQTHLLEIRGFCANCSKNDVPKTALRPL